MIFTAAISKYQADGDRAVFAMVRDAMNYDFLRSPTRMQFNRPEMYVAFRCLRLIHGKLATIKYTLSEYGLNTVTDSPEYIFAEFTATWRSYTR